MDLQQQYGKRYKVTRPDAPDSFTRHWHIVGKRGYIRPYGDNLELYIESSVIAKRIERSESAFKPKNHYDDATAFEFENKPELVQKAAKWVVARNRRQISPEQREIMASRFASLRKKPAIITTSGSK